MSLLSFRSVCINVLLNSGIGAEFFMTCTFGIGMFYSDISLFTYVQIVVYFLNAAFQLVLPCYREDLNCRVRISAGQGFKRKAVYTEGVGPVCKCTGQCTLQGSVQVYFNF